MPQPPFRSHPRVTAAPARIVSVVLFVIGTALHGAGCDSSEGTPPSEQAPDQVAASAPALDPAPQVASAPEGNGPATEPTSTSLDHDEKKTSPAPPTAKEGPPPTEPPLSAVPKDAIWFVEARTGVNGFEHITGARGEYRVPEIFGSGCMLFDCDNDHDLDAYFSQSGLWPDDPEYKPYPNRLYRNDGLGNFVDVTEASGLGDTEYGMGCSAGDYDNDGDLDVWVGNFGKSKLYRNQGNGTFKDVTEEVGLGHDVDMRWWAVSSCWFDYDLDGDLDLHVGHYLNYTHKTNLDCGTMLTGIRDYCSPKEFAGLPDALYRNNGPDEHGRITFTDVIKESGMLQAEAPEVIRNTGKALGCIASDFTGDLWPDLYVANDQVAGFLFINQQDGTFVEEAFIRGCAFSGEGTAQANMGVTSGDFDADGDMDFFVTHLDLEYNTLFENDGTGFFEDVTAKKNMLRPSMGPVGFGTEFFDYDHDTDVDAIVTNGHVLLNADRSRGGVVKYAQRGLLFQNEGKGVFSEMGTSSGPFFSKDLVGRGLAVGDIDNDGDLDVLINMHGDHENRGRRLFGTLLVNAGGNRRPSLLIRLIGDGKRANLQAVGARVRLTCGGKTQIREVHAGTSYASQSDTRLHFGLGDQSEVERIEIIWPDREHTAEVLEKVPAGGTITVKMGEGIVAREPFRK
ncbi:MAG: FG-GAP-like repeat-containing protein [Planctomycetota bacterium]